MFNNRNHLKGPRCIKRLKLLRMYKKQVYSEIICHENVKNSKIWSLVHISRYQIQRNFRQWMTLNVVFIKWETRTFGIGMNVYVWIVASKINKLSPSIIVVAFSVKRQPPTPSVHSYERKFHCDRIHFGSSSMKRSLII